MGKIFRIRKKIFIAVISFLLMAAGVGILFYQSRNKVEVTQAGSVDNVSGWAWNDKYGWISFNSTNCDIDGDGTYEGASEDGGPAPADCPSSGTVNDYGVNIDPTTGDFSGYAWSSNLGWISFNRSDTGNPPSNDPGGGSGPIAQYNSGDNKIYGWAKILALGIDGWLRFDHGQANEVYVDLNSDEIHGYAWNGNDNGSGIGWVSFNCAEEGVCGSSDYKVIGEFNHKPQAINLSAPNWSYSSVCNTDVAKKAILRWQFDDQDVGDTQSAYRIIVSLDNNPSAPNVIDTGKVNSNASQYVVASAKLVYNQSYYWWVEVWDNKDVSSGLVQYNSASDTDNDDGNNLTFTTYKHEFPDPETSEGFIWFPENPSAGEEVKFISTTSAKYYTGDFGTKASCDDAHCNWLWEFVAPTTGVINSPNASTTIVIFSNSNSQTIRLTITDNDGYSCSVDKVIDVKKKLPTWIENR